MSTKREPKPNKPAANATTHPGAQPADVMAKTKISGTARRPRKIESYADWMARIDAHVDTMARRVEREPPSYAWLHPAQRRIVQMLIERMRMLPEIRNGEDVFAKPEYFHVKRIITHLFRAKYPDWNPQKDGIRYVSEIPNGEGDQYCWMLRNCAGRAPAEKREIERDDDDD